MSQRGKVKLPAYTRIDFWVFMAIIPLWIVVCNSLLLGSSYFSSWKIFGTASLLYFIIMFFVFQACGALAVRFLKAMPDVKQIAKRLIISVICYIAITVAAITPTMWIYSKIPWLNYEMVSYSHLWVAVVSAMGNIIITIVFEGIAAFERWKATLVETEQLKKENLRSQLQGLKNQINPHFLFNSINSLSSLISEDPDKAETYLDEMSKVYRYMLRNNEENLIPLSMELQFINSYFHLLKTRYGEGINLNIEVSDECRENVVPPLTLQILVENAVKHNIIAKDQPLNIEIICVDKNQLMVRNNLQRKTVKVMSHRVGLENISAKYQLLNQPEIKISEENGYFIVMVPVLDRKTTIETA